MTGMLILLICFVLPSLLWYGIEDGSIDADIWIFAHWFVFIAVGIILMLPYAIYMEQLVYGLQSHGHDVSMYLAEDDPESVFSSKIAPVFFGGAILIYAVSAYAGRRIAKTVKT